MSVYFTPRTEKPPAATQRVTEPVPSIDVVPPPTPGVEDVPPPTPAAAKSSYFFGGGKRSQPPSPALPPVPDPPKPEELKPEELKPEAPPEPSPAPKKRGYFGRAQPSSLSTSSVPDPKADQKKPEEPTSDQPAGEAAQTDAASTDAAPEPKPAPKKRGYFGRSQPQEPTVPEPKPEEPQPEEPQPAEPTPDPTSQLKPAPKRGYFSRSQTKSPALGPVPEPQSETPAADSTTKPPSAEDQAVSQPKQELKHAPPGYGAYFFRRSQPTTPAAEVPPEIQPEAAAAQPEPDAAAVEPEPVQASADRDAPLKPGHRYFWKPAKAPAPKPQKKEEVTEPGTEGPAIEPVPEPAQIGEVVPEQPSAKKSGYIFRRPKEPVPYTAAEPEESVAEPLPYPDTGMAESVPPQVAGPDPLFPRRFGMYGIKKARYRYPITIGFSKNDICYTVSNHKGIRKPQVILHAGTSKRDRPLACVTSRTHPWKKDKAADHDAFVVTLDYFSGNRTSEKPRRRHVKEENGGIILHFAYTEGKPKDQFLIADFEFAQSATGENEKFRWETRKRSKAGQSLGGDERRHELIRVKTEEVIAVFTPNPPEVGDGDFAFVSSTPLGNQLELLAVVTLLMIFREVGPIFKRQPQPKPVYIMPVYGC